MSEMDDTPTYIREVARQTFAQGYT